MHGNVRENCAAACVSKSSGYRWLAQLRDKGRKSARQTGGREPFTMHDVMRKVYDAPHAPRR
eukprot:1540488-Pyramimonas_sp.AAC.1